MKYEEMRGYIRNGDVLTFSGSWLFSRLIRWWTDQPVSHVGMAMWLRIGNESEDRLCLVESLEPWGVRIMPMSLLIPEYLANDSPVYWQSYLGGNGDEALGWALSKWGQKYASCFQFLSFVLPGFRRLRDRFGLPAKIGSGYHCAELISQAFWFAGQVPPKEPAIMTPGDFHNVSYLSTPERIY